MQWKGVWSDRETYSEGCLVTRSGALWLSKRASLGARPGDDGDAWVLIVKSGSFSSVRGAS